MSEWKKEEYFRDVILTILVHLVVESVVVVAVEVVVAVHVEDVKQCVQVAMDVFGWYAHVVHVLVTGNGPVPLKQE